MVLFHVRLCSPLFFCRGHRSVEARKIGENAGQLLEEPAVVMEQISLKLTVTVDLHKLVLSLAHG